MTTAEIEMPHWLDEVRTIQDTHAFLTDPEPEFSVSGYIDDEDDDDEDDFDDDYLDDDDYDDYLDDDDD